MYIIDFISSFLFLMTEFPPYALFFTILFEFVIYSIAVRKNYGKLFVYAILINLVTWPLANLLYAYFGMFFLIEFLVVLAEIFLIKKLLEVSWIKALVISLIANLITMFFGIVFY